MSGAVIIDTALAARDKPICAALIGTGYMGRGILLQLVNNPKIRPVVVYNRTISKAVDALKSMGVDDSKIMALADGAVENYQSPKDIDVSVVTNDYTVACSDERVEVVIECTGTIEFAADITLKAFSCGKHVVAMNAELDATLGTALKRRADAAGVVFSQADGDQPGVIMNLIRHVRSMGLEPVVAGNMKGFHNEYANPDTQQWFADKFGQNSYMVTSFCDGSKMSIENASVANAVGFKVAKRAMHGIKCSRVEEAKDLIPPESLNLGYGIVDYTLGAHPGPGVFVLAKCEDPMQQAYLKYYKMGDGPVYTFYHPYHLCHMEIANSIARAVLFKDAVITARGGDYEPTVEVVAIAKADLEPGTEIDGIGYFHTFGVCENSEVARAEGLLPLGLALGCRIARPVKKDTPLSFADVDCSHMVDKTHFRLYFEQFKAGMALMEMGGEKEGEGQTSGQATTRGK